MQRLNNRHTIGAYICVQASLLRRSTPLDHLFITVQQALSNLRALIFYLKHNIYGNMLI